MLSLGRPWVTEAEIPNRQLEGCAGCSGERPELEAELCIEGTVEAMAVVKSRGGLWKGRGREAE